MDRPPLKSLCGFSLATTALIIGTVNSIVYAGMFLWEYALQIVEYASREIPTYIIIREMALHEMVNGATLVSCIFSVCLVIGVNKSEPGFILTWLINQFVLMASSFMTVFYFLLASYLKMPFVQFLIELGVNSVHGFCFIVVYSLYIRLRSGNLSDEQA
ncbi:uncharacterized protein [Halyomorpha halys]|uniref:uncharacterized protein n=1 Tax=Halyomorpha halys TaxID=286706 RepID=UPI0006D4E525|nr:uncharacterized protein LOC106681049 isoform X1 [Halyomorpha halys]XP_024219229.1 uncharacterized protein LOC106681049 isoform X2 [Halyomorpha halys]